MNNKTEKQRRYDLCSDYISRLQNVRTLYDIFNLHKRMWADGLRHQNIGPDPFGMFRTEDIATMTHSEVFLGDMHGLWTLPLDKWIGTPEEHIVTEQYRHHLISNVELLKSLVYDHGLDRAKIEAAIAKEAPDSVKISDVKVLDNEMDVLKLMHFSFKADGVEMKSNLFLKTLSLKDDLLLIPKDWFKGEHVDNVHQIRKISHWKGIGHKDRLFGIKKEFLRREFTITSEQNVHKPKIKR